ncbi:hypothetical protein Agabi119p4_889 [Agaricus bisporus var. burnettii]|uniref:RING-type domain-containing protein n=1 Tax=Agaricus bisporus var. burnettii TaxID=192524 RepID=A0A8H7FBJ1_AGABI|nr:hypothetical protein Agabi119p4_889 [Agaricus bisporus var. burnettii]
MSEDEFDNLPDLFSGVTDAEWSRMLDAPGESSSIRHPHGVSPSRSTVSTDYGDEHFVNPEALAEIDRIETSLTSFGGTASARRVGEVISTASGHTTHHQDSLRPPTNDSSQSRYLPNADHCHAHTLVRSSVACPTEAPEKQAIGKRSRLEDAESTVVKNGIVRAYDKIQYALDGYGEELCCPICCDLFVATHLGNPCGHSYCGDCAWQWVNKNDRTECPICRTQLVGEAPLIPNITLDSLIEKHIELLISAGDIDWLPQGSKYKDRASRKAKWKASVDARSKALKTKRKRKEVVFISSDDEDPYIEHSSQGTGQADTEMNLLHVRLGYFYREDIDNALIFGIGSLPCIWSMSTSDQLTDFTKKKSHDIQNECEGFCRMKLSFRAGYYVCDRLSSFKHESCVSVQIPEDVYGCK